MLRISLLGQFDVQVEGKRTAIPARAAQSLLAFLVLTAGVPHRREKIAGMLWPDMSDENARRSLRHELWRLRKALGANQTTPSEYLLSEELAIQFNPRADYWLDVAQLEREPAPDDSIGDVIGRLSLYRGELLPGFYDDWVGPERQRVQALYESRMDHFLNRLISEERWATVVEWAERWIAVGHSPEAAYRALMVAHNALGEKSKVALDYERCVEALDQDLDIDPSPETRSLFDRLSPGRTGPPEQPGKTPAIFVQASGTVTFLFSDIEGSTHLLDRLGDEYARLLEEQRDLLRELGEKHHGHEIDTQGDSFFFAFFRAADAVAFATEAQRAIATHQWPQEAALRVRMGLHTGEPMLARTGYVGMDVHRAARIGSAGHGGQVLLSQTTRALVENELPDGTTLRDLGEHKLKDLRYPVHIVQLTIDGLPADFPPLKSINTGNEPPAPGDPPYKGLEYFDKADAGLFFGREPLVAKLASEVRAHRFLAVVVGASGSGKSSVVRAGLIPALQNLTAAPSSIQVGSDWKVFVVTPTAHPLEALATVLTREESLTTTATLLDDLAREPRSLHLFFKRMLLPDLATNPTGTQPRRILLVVDQFEELFTLCRDELEREQFIDNLVNALTPSTDARRAGSDLTLVLTIRADFYAHLAEYPELRDLVAKQQEYIGPMNSDELRRAIEEPAKRGGWEFEPGLVDLILRDVGDEPGALPLLSHALLETWKRRSGHLMTLKGYHDAGGVRGAIALTAETTYQALSPEQQRIARNIFMRLTELGTGTEDTRRRADLGELETGEGDRFAVRGVLTLLADARLITTGEHTAEVAHEALIREWARLREWLNEDREGLKLHRALTEAAHEWELMERDASMLYRGARLAQAREWASTNQERINQLERVFIGASEEQEIKETREREAQQARELAAARRLATEQQARADEQSNSNKRLRQRALFLAGAFVLALVLAGIALFFSESANRNAFAAEQSAAVALTNANAAESERLKAEQEKRAASARELAAAAVVNLDTDPERSILLALRTVDATRKIDGIVLKEAEEALHRAVQTSRVVRTLQVPGEQPRGITYSSDGRQLATNSVDGFIRLWDVTSGAQVRAFPIEKGYWDNLYFNADGTQLATMDVIDDQTMQPKILDVQTGEVVRATSLPISPKDWWLSAYSPDWTRVVVGTSDGKATVWDMNTGKLLLTLAGHTDTVADVAYSPDGTRIATASFDETAKIWDAQSGKELVTLRGHSDPILRIVFDKAGKHIATGSQDHTAKVWDAATGKELYSLTMDDWVTCIGFTADGKRIATLSLRKAKIWDAGTGQELFTLVGHTGFVRYLALNADGTRLATSAGDSTIRIWDIGQRGEDVAVATTGPLTTPTYLGNVNFSPDGRQFAVGLRDGRVKVWDGASGAETLNLRGHTEDVRVVFSPDGRWIGTASSDKTAKIWDAKTGQEQITFRGHAEPVGMIAFHPDGARVATGSEDFLVKIWNLNTGQELQSFDLHSFQVTGDVVFGLDFSPDGSRLAISTGSGFVLMLDLATGKELYHFQRGPEGVFNIMHSPDGSRLAISTVAPTGAIVLDAITGQELVTLSGIPINADWIAYSHDGKRLATAHLGDGIAKIWDAETGKELLTLYGGQSPPFAVDFSPDGSQLAVVGDEDVRVYLLNVDDLLALARTRVTRSLTQEECVKYLHVDKCPTE